MTYEFITPSDPITFKAESDKVAFFCAVLLGNGKAGIKREDGEKCESTMLFLSSDPMPIILEYLGCPLRDFLDANTQEIIECLRSFAYGGFEARKKYDAAISVISIPQILAAFKKEHEHKERSSMSRWVKSAWDYADGFEKKMKEKTAEPIL